MSRIGKNSLIWQISLEELKQVIIESNSLSQVLQRFGYSAGGRSQYTLVNRLKHEGIDPKICDRTLLQRPVKLDSEVFTEKSSYARTSLKKRIIKNALIPYICDNCGNDGRWDSKNLSLQLEHKNGISNDNRIENLCFLCPNCHSQTDTYAGKSRNKCNKQYVFPDDNLLAKNACKENKTKRCASDRCHNHISKESTHCLKCFNQYKVAIPKRKVERPSLEILKTDVLELGYVGAGKKYGVSDNAVRKWIQEYEKNANITESFTDQTLYKLSLSHNELHNLLNVQKLNLTQIARRYGVATNTVKHTAEVLGVDVPKSSKSVNDEKINVTKEQLYNLLVIQGISYADLNSMFGVARGAVQRRAKQLGII